MAFKTRVVWFYSSFVGICFVYTSFFSFSFVHWWLGILSQTSTISQTFYFAATVKCIMVDQNNNNKNCTSDDDSDLRDMIFVTIRLHLYTLLMITHIHTRCDANICTCKKRLKQNVSINDCNVDGKIVFSQKKKTKIINRTTWLIIFWKMNDVFSGITSEKRVNKKNLSDLISYTYDMSSALHDA